MKNPFEKPDNSRLIAAVLVGAALAGTAAWLFLTDSGASKRGGWKKKVKAKIKEKAAKVASKKTGVNKKLAKIVTDKIID